jgi:RND superfamily putative drug exporter
MVEVAVEGEERDAKDKVDALVAQTAAVQADHPGLLLEETGSPSISKGVDQQRGDDLALSEKITLPVTLLTLLVVFGSLTMAAVPLVLALSSIAAAVGLSMVASHVSPDAGVGTNVILGQPRAGANAGPGPGPRPRPGSGPGLRPGPGPRPGARGAARG